MHLTNANVRRLAAVNMPIGRLTWKMKFLKYSDGAPDEGILTPWTVVAVLWCPSLLIYGLYGPG